MKTDKPLVHFVADGFTVLGRVWMRGDELNVQDGAEYDWARQSETEQLKRYGRVLFRPGSFPLEARTDPRESFEARREAARRSLRETGDPEERLRAQKSFLREFGDDFRS